VSIWKTVCNPPERNERALEPHAGINIALRQRLETPIRSLVEFHEDVVPDLDEAATIAVRMTRSAEGLNRAARRCRKRFRCRDHMVPGSGWPPPVLALGIREDALVGFRVNPARPEGVLPEPSRFQIMRRVRVALKDGHVDPVWIDVQPLRAGQKLERPRNRFRLEVIAERPVAQHLEKREMTVVAHLIDVPVRTHFCAFARRVPAG
jgi:hypothetical protein